MDVKGINDMMFVAVRRDTGNALSMWQLVVAADALAPNSLALIVFISSKCGGTDINIYWHFKECIFPSFTLVNF